MSDQHDRDAEIGRRLRDQDPEKFDRVVARLAKLPSIDDLDPMTAAEIIVEIEAEDIAGETDQPET